MIRCALLTTVLAVVIGSVRLGSPQGSSEWAVDQTQRAVRERITSEWRTLATDRLTGSYRLNRDRSDDAGATSDPATRDLPGSEQPCLRSAIARRVGPPDSLSIERDGRTITIASPRANPVTFEADGREQAGRSRTGRRTHTTATLSGDRLVIGAGRNRSIDYQLTFEPIDNGRRLRVTRRAMPEGRRQAVETTSTYDRTSDAPQRDVPRDNRDACAPGETSRGRVIVADGTTLVVKGATISS